MPDLVLHPYEPETDLDWANALLDAELGGRMQARRGKLMDPLEGEGVVADLGGRRVGFVTWLTDVTGDRAEIRALAVSPDFRGRAIGRALLEAAHTRLRSVAVRRAWLVTTNDNLAALALYQQLGYRLKALRVGAVDEARRALKPAIGQTGEHGIPIRDELELERILE